MAKAKSKAIEAPTSTREHTSVSVEKISNGYLVRTSRSDGNGYKETTAFHPKKPQVSIPVTPAKKGK